MALIYHADMGMVIFWNMEANVYECVHFEDWMNDVMCSFLGSLFGWKGVK